MNFYHELAKMVYMRRSDEILDSQLIINGKTKAIPQYHWCNGCQWAKNLGDRYMCPFVEGSCVRFPQTFETPDAEMLHNRIKQHHDYEKAKGMNTNA